MAGPGFNATRRSRNIGTARQGHGQDNRLTIPEDRADWRGWGQRLGPHQQFQRNVGGKSVRFFVETTTADYAHACSIEDICRLLACLPPGDWAGLDTFLLRQSTVKQRTLRPAWGRMFYLADLGYPGRKSLYEGPVIILEAQQEGAALVWGTGLSPDDQAELDRLREDGHPMVREGRRWVIRPTLQATRATQLYRTLLHEIGHWIDYRSRVEEPSAAGESFDLLHDAYFARPRHEREAFAHRYADETRTRLTGLGLIPFAPLPLKTVMD